MRLSRHIFVFIFALIGLMNTVDAQVTTATIVGTVTDSNNEPLIGATVVATHTPSGTNYGTTTRDDGRYSLPNLRVGGPYQIVTSYLGYETQTQNDVFLNLAQKLKLDIALQEESTTVEGVVVTANRNAILNSERTGAETNIGQEAITKLPTISRSTSDFTRLTPSSDGNSFGGRNDQFNNFSLDGSIFNNPFGLDAATPGGQSGASPISLDAIDQINVSLAPYDVTQAGFTGAAVNAVTKSGTNEFKGSVFGFTRNQALTGSKVDGQDIIVPDLGQLQYGASLGGPIIKDKVFFFANFEVDQREDLGTTIVANRGNAGSNVNRVSADSLDMIRTALMDRYGYDTGDYEGYFFNTNSVKGIVKLDFALNKKNTLTATYNFLDAFKEKPAHPSAIGRRGPDLTTIQFRNSGYRINNAIHSGIVELRTIFNNKVSNKFQAGYSMFRDKRNPFSDPFPVLNINQNGVRAIVAGHEPFSIHNELNQDVFQFTDNLNIYAGDHTFTAGISFERFDFDNSFNLGVYEPFGFPYSGGTFAPGFSSVKQFLDYVDPANQVDILDADGNVIGQTNPMDVVVEHARSVYDGNGGDDGIEGEGWALAETNVGQFAAYIQDEWAITNNLTVTAGLRMDMPLYFNTRTKIQENLDRNSFTYDPTITWYDENNEAVVFDHLDLPKQTPLFSPRLGFNYDVKGDQTVQLRGGSGLFTGRFPFVWIGNQVANPSWFFYNKTANNFKFPQVWRSNLGYDQKFGDGWIVTADVIYTKDLNAALVRNYTLRNPSGTLNDPSNRPFYTNSEEDRVQYFGAPLNGSGYVFTNTNLGQSFNASVQVTKQFTNGLNLMLGYNYLDARDASSIDAEISSDAFERNPIVGNANQAVLAPSIYGAKHRFIGSAFHTFKYAQGRMATTVSTFFAVAQGGTTASDFVDDYRFSYTYSGDANRDGSGLNDLIYIPTESELEEQNWTSDEERNAFNEYIKQDKYLSANRGSFAERYAVLAPWYSSWDVRVLQDFNFNVGKKTHTIQLSFDILNFGNLLNSAWNVKQLPINASPVGISVTEAGDATYSFDTSLTETFAPTFDLDSRWQGRVGLRYIF